MRRHLFLPALLWIVACGGSTESELGSTSPNGDSSSGGSSSGGTSSGGTSSGGTSSGGTSSGGTSSGGTDAGGTDAGGTNTGGTSSNGGTDAAGGTSLAGQGGTGASGSGGGLGGTSGSSGQAGAGGQPVDCAPPSDPTKAALCVTFDPEAMDFDKTDPQLDGDGLLFLAAYDTPFPDGDPGAQDDIPPLVSTIFPPQSGPSTTLVNINQMSTVRLDGLPPTAYLRAFFFDNLEALEQKNISWGVWLGGLELSGGLQENIPLNKLSLPAGKGTPLQMPLTALRRLEVTVKLAEGTKPLDGASGPFQWFAFPKSTLAEGEAVFGLSSERCLDLFATPNPVVRGFAVGSGARYVVGRLNDFNQVGNINGGEILNVNPTAGGLEVVGGLVSVGPKEYRKSHSIDLSFVVPLGAGAAPPPYTCP